MKTIQLSVFALIMMSGSAFAVEPANNGIAQSKANVQRAPVIGGMLPDGREVPARFQGVETKEQKARRERQEREKSESERD